MKPLASSFSMLKRIAYPCLAVAVCLGVAGCSGGAHQIISMTQDCSSCHQDQKTTYESAEPAAVTESGLQVIVETKAEKVVVCKPVFTSEDGSKYVPVKQSEVKVVDGKATVDLQPGVWALCLDNGSSSVGQIVRASDTANVNVSIAL